LSGLVISELGVSAKINPRKLGTFKNTSKADK